MWDKEEQGLVLGSIFWGYMLTNIAGGVAATRYGGKRVIGLALACASVLTAVTPAAARSSVYAMLCVRVLLGVCLVSTDMFQDPTSIFKTCFVQQVEEIKLDIASRRCHRIFA